LCVLSSVIVVSGILMASGVTPTLATVVTLVASAGAVEVACRLTSPFHAPRIRACVVMVILMYVVILHAVPYPPLTAVAIALGTTALATEVARRLTGLRYQMVRLAS
jgi:ABC-type uncharacterized transport system permease subunit